VTGAASHCDAIIVGGGIVGAACAEALARDGARVTVLEQGRSGGGATAAAMGHLVVMDDSPAQLALTAYAMRLWHDRRDTMPLALERLDAGTLWIAEHEEELAAATAKAETYRAAGIRAELVDSAALSRAEPRLRGGLAGALHVPDDAVIYPPAAVQWQLAHAVNLGAELREGMQVRRVGARRVETEGATLHADVVVVAAGCGSATLVPELPIVPRKGHLIVTDRYPDFCRHQLVELGYLASAHGTDGPSVAFNLQPRPTAQLLIGSSRQLVGLDGAVDREIVRRMVDRALHFVPALGDLHATRVWTGFRPATPDSLPLIGAWPALDGVWIAAGHEGLGITTALATAQILADQIAGRPPAIDPAPYAPDRVWQKETAPAHA
jgi:glycine/D-amino acid oxidase-like deaminating enzyme